MGKPFLSFFVSFLFSFEIDLILFFVNNEENGYQKSKKKHFQKQKSKILVSLKAKMAKSKNGKMAILLLSVKSKIKSKMHLK